ncbi:MAG: DUF2927 domain-containing protein [Bacteroidota bacterium]
MKSTTPARHIGVKTPLHFLALLFLAFACSCTNDEPTDDSTSYPPEMLQEDINTIEYFKDVALGFENGQSSEITRKWATDMKIFISGNPGELPKNYQIQQTLDEINSLATDGFQVEIVEDSLAANCHLYFANADEIVAQFPDWGGPVDNSLGRFFVWWQSNRINRARIWVNNERGTPEQRQSIIMEEITQALGLGKDSSRYPGSIFYETPTNGGFATTYLDIDKELIRLLYHPDMTVGLNAPQVQRVLTDVLLSE